MNTYHRHLLAHPTADADTAFKSVQERQIRERIVQGVLESNKKLKKHSESPLPGNAKEEVSAEVHEARSHVHAVLVSLSPEEREFKTTADILAKADLTQKNGRKTFADVCVQLRILMGKMRSASGRFEIEHTSTLMDSLRKNVTLAPFFRNTPEDRLCIDVRNLTPKVISALRHLTRDFGLLIEDGLSSEYDHQHQTARMTLEMTDATEVQGYSPYDINPKAKKHRKQFSSKEVRGFLEQAQRDGSWLLLVGHSEHKLTQEFVAIPNVQELIREGSNRFLFAVNAFINAVLNENKGVVPGREKLSARIIFVPEDAGDHYLSSLVVIGDFPMVHLKHLGQQLVLKVDKTNHEQFDRVLKRLTTKEN